MQCVTLDWIMEKEKDISTKSAEIHNEPEVDNKYHTNSHFLPLMNIPELCKMIILARVG